MQKTIKVFGYGSLINQDSLKQTSPNSKILYPALLYGFTRVFNVPSPSRFCEKTGDPCAVLNVEKSEWNEYINGVCIEVPFEEFEQLFEREEGYELVQVDINHFNDEKQERAYMYRALHFEAHDFQIQSNQQLEYVKICEEGCREFGNEFLQEFKKTTFIGDKTLFEIDL